MRNLAFFTIALAFLTDISNRLSEQLKADFDSERVSFDDQVLELKKEVVGGGTQHLLEAKDDRIDGINSFDKNTLKTGRAFVFDQISILYASNAASGKEGSLTYTDEAPAELQNATLIITQDGREVLRLPVRDAHNLENGNNIADQYKQLKSLRYFKDEATIEIQLKFPPNVSLPTDVKHYVYLRFNGLQTTKRA